MPRFARFVLGHRRSVLVAARTADDGVLGYGATGLRVNPTLERLRSVTEGARFLEEVTDAFALPSDVIVMLQTRPIAERLLEENRAARR